MHIHLTQLITQYGSIALFFLLALGIVGLPIPDETLLVTAGAFIAHGDLHFSTTVLAAFSGSIFGVTLSYLLGRTLGYKMLHDYGGYIGVTQEKLQKSHDWFEHYGKWLVFIGYFITGFRHLTGILAGLVKLEYWVFALFAYSGALGWCLLFVSIGYFSFSNIAQYLPI
jgi:membrane protein DedA with SNARE-associated domain